MPGNALACPSYAPAAVHSLCALHMHIRRQTARMHGVQATIHMYVVRMHGCSHSYVRRGIHNSDVLCCAPQHAPLRRAVVCAPHRARHMHARALARQLCAIAALTGVASATDAAIRMLCARPHREHCERDSTAFLDSAAEPQMRKELWQRHIAHAAVAELSQHAGADTAENGTRVIQKMCMCRGYG